MRPRLANLPPALLLVLASAGVAASAEKVELDRGLRAIEAGAPIPVANRPFDRSGRLAARVFGREFAPPRESYTPPSEFGVLLEFDGSRAELEAAGLRVVTQAGRLFTARVRPDEIGVLRRVSGVRSVRLSRYQELHLNLSIPDVRADLEHAAVGIPPTYNGRAGTGILVGDVDTGIDFTRSDFNDDLGKTRIQYIWDQTDAVGPSPLGFGYGSEWTKLNIDNTPGIVRQRDTNGHGTLVAGVLVGNGSLTGCSQSAYRFVGMAPLAQFIEVKTDLSDSGIIDGVDYIFKKAAAMGLDAVVNLSLGSQFGPHDGTDLFSSAISSLTGPGRIVVASAGNNQGTPIHGRLTTTSTTVGADRFTFSIPSYTPVSGTFNDFVVVTGWYDPSSSYTIRVKGPNATDTLSVGFGQGIDRDLPSSGGKGGKLFVANQSSALGFGGTSKDRQFEVQVYDSVASNAPRNGTWEIDVVSNGAANIGKRVDIWIYGSSFGASALTASVVTGLDNTTMVGEPADGDSVIAVAAHATKASWTSCANGGCGYSLPPTLGAIASFSNVGPRRDGVIKPDLSAPGFGVATTHSSQAAAIGFCADADDGQHEVTQGTSFSAPHVSGAAALFLQYQPGSSPSKVKLSMKAHARSDGFTGAVPNSTWGWGKLDVYATIDHVAPTASITSPVGGEAWAANSAQNILWTASDNVGVTSVDLRLSTNSGASYPTVIAAGIANTGSYGWTVPNLNTTTARVQVTAHDAGANTAVSASAADFTISQQLNVPPNQPAEFAVSAHPNPMSGSSVVEMAVPREARVRLAVVDLQGREIQRLATGVYEPGRYTFTWDGTTRGHQGAAGLYFVKYETPSRVIVERLVVAR